MNTYSSTYNRDDLYETRRLLNNALAVDPNYARAFVALSRTYLTAWINPLDGDFQKSATLDRAHELVRRAVQLDPNLPHGHAQLGAVLVWKSEHEAAIVAFSRAAAINPNFTDYRFASAWAFAGEPAKAIEVAQAHMHLDPFYIPMVCGWLGLAHFMQRRYAEAVLPLRELVSRAPNFRSGHIWLAATLAQMGSVEEARKEAAEVLRVDPSYTIGSTGRRLAVFKNAADAEHFFEGLRKAGLPER